MIYKCGLDMSYYSRAHGVCTCLARGQRLGWYCPGHCPRANHEGANPLTHVNDSVEHVCTHGLGTRTASPERERHTCKPGHTRVHKELKNRNYELPNRPWLSFWLVVTGEWERIPISWIFRCWRKWAQQESDANALSRTLNERSTLVQVMAWDHQATSRSLRKCWPRLYEYIVTWSW